ncbi:hypothetical protein [Pontimicrobium sp. MEBiC06410]
MKKVVLGIIFLIALSATFTSCEAESITTDEYQTDKNSNGTIENPEGNQDEEDDDIY